jgi:ElaA protein
LPIRISAQAYLQPFYASLGFEAVSDTYLEDGIPHVEMLRATREPGESR